ncbi:MAG: ATP-grasp domain-containing protein [Candidatus Moranbacteria bacterium]|nr:ATP-grasp domain-containing protein [Candidatus Moranbacteria bacterium]
MNFYCILEPKKNSWVRDLFSAACRKQGVNYEEIDVSTNKLDFVNYPMLLPGDCLYRAVANSKNAKKVEYCLVKEGVSTFYNSADAIFRPASGIKLPKFGIPIPKTIPVLTNDRDILKTFSENLGGFPLIVKAMGGKEGVGVMRVDSLESLCSIADFLYKSEGNFVLRQYINSRESLRIIILGEKVIASMKYKASHEGDFRSNRKTKLDNVENIQNNPQIEKIAIEAVKAMGLEFGGVDILLDEKNNPYVLEVNFPCHFGEAQTFTNVDIAGQMIDYLIKKSYSLNKK